MAESFSTLLELFTFPDFIIGVAFGVAGLFVLFVAPHDAAGEVRGFGVVFALAAAIAINFAIDRNLSLIAAVVLLGLGGTILENSIASSTESLKWAGWLAIGVGTVFISTRTGVDDLTWIRVGIALVGLTAADATRRNPDALPQRVIGPMVAISAFAIWTTVPDTDAARVVLGVSLAMAVATLPGIKARLNGAGAFPLFTLIAWSVAIGGVTRPASVVGGWACLGLLFLAPVAVRWLPGMRFGTGISLGIHTALVLVAARVIGLWQAALPALLAVCGLAAVGFVALRAGAQRESRSERL